MKNSYLHIGLGKAASSKLQRDIFPLIAKFLNLVYIGNENIPLNDKEIKIKAKITKHCHDLLFGKNIKKLNFDENFIISNEGLSSYRQPQYYKEFSEKNLEAFGENIHVILVIRKPKDFLNSIYMQTCIHEKPFQEPDHFFLEKKDFTERLPNSTFLIDHYNYSDLINLYVNKFSCVSIIKYEALNDMLWAKEIFNLDEKQVDLLKKKFTENKLNQSLGLKSIRFIKFISKMLRLISFDFKHKYSNEIILKRHSLEEIEKEYYVRKKLPFLKKLLTNFNLFINKPYIIDKLLGYKKFSLDFEKLSKIDINELEKNYKKIPNFQTIIKD